MNRRAFVTIWIPLAVVAGLYLTLGYALFGAHTGAGRAGRNHVAARPPALFSNGEVARIAGTNTRVRILAHRWNGHEWVYAVTPTR